jgi:hypothetical protein
MPLRQGFLFVASVLLVIAGFTRSQAQELRCKVDIVTQEVETNNPQLFRTMERTIRRFMNNTNWTDKNLKPQEKIRCNLVINISKVEGQQDFEASARIKSSRPVYGSSYSSSILNYFDQEFNFKYRENQRLNYTRGSYSSNLSSLLAYYAFLIIGVDFDTFGESAGTPYYQRAEGVANVAQSSPFKGWTRRGDNSRVRFINRILSARFEPFRKALYQYHRKGLDQMYEETDKGRKQILQSLQKLEKLNQQVPNSFLVRQFFEAKSEEVGNIFSEAPEQEKSQAISMLQKLDASNLSQYKQVIQE